MKRHNSKMKQMNAMWNMTASEWKNLNENEWWNGGKSASGCTSVAHQNAKIMHRNVKIEWMCWKMCWNGEKTNWNENDEAKSIKLHERKQNIQYDCYYWMKLEKKEYWKEVYLGGIVSIILMMNWFYDIYAFFVKMMILFLILDDINSFCMVLLWVSLFFLVMKMTESRFDFAINLEFSALLHSFTLSFSHLPNFNSDYWRFNDWGFLFQSIGFSWWMLYVQIYLAVRYFIQELFIQYICLREMEYALIWAPFRNSHEGIFFNWIKCVSHLYYFFAFSFFVSFF